MKRLAIILMIFGLFLLAAPAHAAVTFTGNWDEIEYAAGTGADQALLVIDFGNTSSEDSYLFGYNFSAGTDTGWDMIEAVGTLYTGGTLDSGVLYYDYTDYGGGSYFIDNFYYNGETTDAGTWWQYYVSETDVNGDFEGWASSGTGATGRTLSDLSWDGWYNPGFIDEGTPSVVPVPAAAWLLGSGLLGLIGIRRRQS